jgi:hypothetical protein
VDVHHELGVAGGLRSQFTRAIDIVLTIYEGVGIKPSTMMN